MAKDQIMSAEQVIDRTTKYLNEEHVALVRKAYEFAADAHKEQYRKSGVNRILFILFR